MIGSALQYINTDGENEGDRMSETEGGVDRERSAGLVGEQRKGTESEITANPS